MSAGKYNSAQCGTIGRRDKPKPPSVRVSGTGFTDSAVLRPLTAAAQLDKLDQCPTCISIYEVLFFLCLFFVLTNYRIFTLPLIMVK